MAKAPKGKRKPARKSQTGVMQLTRKGYGFVCTDSRDFFVAGRDLKGAMDRDVVTFRVIKNSGGEQSARVVGIEKRATKTFVGRFSHLGEFAVVVPRDKNIKHDGFVIKGTQLEGIEVGDWVLAEIVQYPDYATAMEVMILKKIADASEVVPLDVIATENDIKASFDYTLEEHANAMKLDVNQVLAQEPNRRDIRSRFIFTVDPEDAKDFDDAISLEIKNGNYHLGVHIADVSHFVEVDSSLDREALERGNSTYLPGRVIPMLPENLSNKLCSLMPGEDRLSFTVDMVLNKDAQLLSSSFYRSVINSNARLSYQEALAIIEGESDISHSEQLVESIKNFDTLAEALGNLRNERGGLDFNTPEPKITLDETGHPLSVELRISTRATKMIEEAMILANETVARYLFSKKLATIYRVHEEPNKDALEEAYKTLEDFGYKRPEKNLNAFEAYQRIIACSAGKPEEHFIASLLLRTLKRAYYATEPIGHFGLSSPYYTHFTSPIRRYADLVVHRVLSQVIDQNSQDLELQYSTGKLNQICLQLGMAEQNTKKAERDATSYKIAEYMKGHIGEVYAAIITEVRHFGLFVTLDNSASGLVHLNTFKSRGWRFHPKKHTLVSADGSEELGVGRQIVVRLISVDLSESNLDFELVE